MLPYIYIGDKVIGSYGLMMALAVLLVGALSFRKAKQLNVLREDILIVGATVIGFALLGGKLLYIFVTYSLPWIWEQICAGNLRIFSDGGIVFYGGLIGGLLGAILGIRIAKCDFWHIEHAVIPYVPLGHAIGRIGCLLAGCCHGCKYDGIFAIYYPNSVQGLSPAQGYFPIQLAEAVWNVAVSVCLIKCAGKCKKPFALISVYLLLYAVGRFVLEFFRGDTVRGIYFGLSVSQWISMGLVVACLIWWFCTKRIAIAKK